MTSTTDISRIVRNYKGELHSNKSDNQQEKDKFLDCVALPRLNHKKIEYLMCSSIDSVIKKKNPNKENSRTR